MRLICLFIPTCVAAMDLSGPWFITHRYPNENSPDYSFGSLTLNGGTTVYTGSYMDQADTATVNVTLTGTNIRIVETFTAVSPPVTQTLTGTIRADGSIQGTWTDTLTNTPDGVFLMCRTPTGTFPDWSTRILDVPQVLAAHPQGGLIVKNATGWQRWRLGSAEDLLVLPTLTFPDEAPPNPQLAVGHDGSLILSGRFVSIAGLPIMRVARRVGDTWTSMGTVDFAVSGSAGATKPAPIREIHQTADGSWWAFFTARGNGFSRPTADGADVAVAARWDGTAWDTSLGIPGTANTAWSGPTGVQIAGNRILLRLAPSDWRLFVPGSGWRVLTSIYPTLGFPSGGISDVQIAPDGTLAIAGTSDLAQNHLRVVRVSVDGVVTVLASESFGSYKPELAIDHQGRIYLQDTYLRFLEPGGFVNGLIRWSEGTWTNLEGPGKAHLRKPIVNDLDGHVVFGYDANQWAIEGYAPANHPPIITVPAALSVVAGATASVTATATDPDAGQTLTFALVTPPVWITIDSSTGVITAAPPEGTPTGDSVVQVTVTDGAGGTAQTSCTVTVATPPPVDNHPPIITVPATLGVVAGATASVTATATDPDAGQTLTFALVTPPVWITIDSSTGVITAAPPEGTPAGDSVVQVTVTDGAGGTAQASCTVTVATPPPVDNHPPIITVPATLDVVAGATASVMATATDPDAGQTLTFALVTPPVWITIDSSTGVITAAPPEGTPAGSTVVQVMVDDSAGGSAQAACTIIVTRSSNGSGAPSSLGGGNSGSCGVGGLTGLLTLLALRMRRRG